MASRRSFAKFHQWTARPCCCTGRHENEPQTAQLCDLRKRLRSVVESTTSVRRKMEMYSLSPQTIAVLQSWMPVKQVLAALAGQKPLPDPDCMPVRRLESRPLRRNCIPR